MSAVSRATTVKTYRCLVTGRRAGPAVSRLAEVGVAQDGGAGETRVARCTGAGGQRVGGRRDVPDGPVPEAAGGRGIDVEHGDQVAPGVLGGTVPFDSGRLVLAGTPAPVEQLVLAEGLSGRDVRQGHGDRRQVGGEGRPLRHGDRLLVLLHRGGGVRGSGRGEQGGGSGDRSGGERPLHVHGWSFLGRMRCTGSFARVTFALLPRIEHRRSRPDSRGGPRADAMLAMHVPGPPHTEGVGLLYIAFLRGMNVPGRSVKMVYLRELFRDMGFEAVRTYIQSGNVFFESGEDDRDKLSHLISTHLRETLGYEVVVCLRTVPELEALVALDPFADVDVRSDMRCCVVFTTDRIDPEMRLPLISPKKDMEIIRVNPYEAFVLWYLINGKAPAVKGFQERALGRDATTRYFHTVVKILDAAKKGAS